MATGSTPATKVTLPKDKEVKEEDRKAEDSIGPEGNPDDRSYVFPKDVKDPVDNTEKVNKNSGYATPDQLNAETAEQTAARYGLENKVSEEDLDNPRVQVYRDTLVNQVPSGTHLHPDVALDLLNRGVAETHTDNAQVKRTIVEVYDFAPDAAHNDKFTKPEDDKDNK